MAWRGSVKARHLIVAIADYFVEKYSSGGAQDTSAAQVDDLLRAASPTHTDATLSRPLTASPLGWDLHLRALLPQLQGQWTDAP